MKQTQTKILSLLRTLRDLTAQQFLCLTTTRGSQIEQTQKKLNDIYIARAAHTRHMLKAKQYVMGDKASALLANRLRTANAQSKIGYILTDEGKKVIKPQDICNAFTKFYSKLYNLREDAAKHQPTLKDISQFLDQVTLPRLTNDQIHLLTDTVTPQEIE
ncbi:Hypothetical predicted protein [Pelobates cultripes]|uniref:Uncharacterized protein n=1 Tax=Pelobates cultripes TaxID=61616 RepID=A0AAD1SJ94_PELCU|nr:Hypothetical predicted protein [Pelobates cultripes]